METKYIAQDDKKFIIDTLKAAKEQIDWLHQLLHRSTSSGECVKMMLEAAVKIVEDSQ